MWNMGEIMLERSVEEFSRYRQDMLVKHSAFVSVELISELSRCQILCGSQYILYIDNFSELKILSL